MDDLSEALHQVAEGGPAAPDGLYEKLARRRRRRDQARTVAALSVAVIFVALGAVFVADLGNDRQQVVPGDGGSHGWQELPPGPLSARHGALAVAVAGDVVVVGGFDGPMCPPTASCDGPAQVARADGAIFDLSTMHWGEIARAPKPVAGFVTRAVLGSRLHVLAEGGAHLAYDASTDRWEQLAAPTFPTERMLATVGSRLVAASTGRRTPDQVYDGTSRTWRDLPLDPLLPSPGREVVPAGDELIALGTAPTDEPGHTPPYVRASALDLTTSTWRQIPPAHDLMFAAGWTWDGQRLVNPSQSSADGGEVEPWPRRLYSGGALEPRTGAWSRLAAPPDAGTAPSGLSLSSSGTRFKAAGSLLFDALENRWHTVDRPPATVGSSGAETWIGDVLFVWGGVTPYVGAGGGELVSTGGLYRP